jgi:hypothetical protein
MKSKNLLLSLIALTFLSASVFLIRQGANEQRRFHPKSAESDEGIGGAIEWLAKIRGNQVTGLISNADVIQARKQIAELQNNKAMGIAWDELGPSNVGGRTRAMLIDKDNHNLLFIGGVSGGLWKSTSGGTSWVPVTGFPDMNVACIAQNQTNGALYVGTGESFSNPDGTNFGTPGFIGSGLYESTDAGATWHIYNGATPSVLNSANDEWSFVNRVAVDPVSGRVFAASTKGLQYWDGTAWINPIYVTGTTPNTGKCSTVVIGPDRTVIAVVANKVYISTSLGDDHSFTQIPTSILPSGIRTEIAIAPSNANYIYALIAASDRSLKGVYRSTDKGTTWDLIGPGGAPAFNLFGDTKQGDYDNAIAVSPFSPDFILVGGINVWSWMNGGNFTQITYGDDSHVDIHAFAFDKTNPYVYYVGSDGGIAKTSDGGVHFYPINKNYNVTQLYAVAFSTKGYVMGGTQDNNCPFIDRKGIDSLACRLLYIGDGGWAAFSAIDTSVFFGTMQNGGTWRSPDQGATYQSARDKLFFSTTMIGSASPGDDGNFAPFVTPLIHWESFHNTYSFDSVTYVAPKSDTAGTEVWVKSHNARYPFTYVLLDSITQGDSVRVQDIISSRFFVALASGIWMTKSALDFSKTPVWIKICDKGGIQNLAISNDGNYLFAGTGGGQVIRISNLLAVRDSINGYITSPYCVLEQKVINTFSSRYVTSIAIDPNNPAHIIVTLGNWGNTDYIYYCANALDAAPTFANKQGITAGKKLPAMPIFSGLIEVNDGKRVLVGTEYGVFGTDDITKNAATIEWTQENTGMAPVPTFMIRQQTQMGYGATNYGVIYIGTHGRGFFETKKWYNSVPDIDAKPVLAKPTLNIYPNPVVNQAHINFTLPFATNVNVNVYDIKGQLVRSLNLSRQTIGNHTTSVDCSMLSPGSYILQLVAGKESSTAKFVITK